MKIKSTLIAFLVGIMNFNLAYAQTDNEFWAEEFLAEVFYGYMTPQSPKVYLEKQTYLPMFIDTKVPNSNNADDVFEIQYEEYDNPIMWNENAPIFKQSKYKKLIFVDDISKLPKRKRKKAEQRDFSKPLLSKSGKYALIDVTYSNLIKGKKWDSKKPWKIFGRTKYFHTSETYRYIYQKIDDKWVRIEQKLTGSSE